MSRWLGRSHVQAFFLMLVCAGCNGPPRSGRLFSPEGVRYALDALHQMMFGVDIASTIAFDTQPVGGAAGGTLATQPVVGIHVAGGAVVGSGADANAQVTIIMTQGTGLLSGTTTVNAVAGQATFTNLSVDTPGIKVFTAMKANTALAPASGVTRGTPPMYVDSNAFTTTAAAASKLVFVTSPGGGTAGTTWSRQPVVQIQDASGNLVTSGSDSTATVTLTQSAGTLTGTAAVAAVGGVVIYAGIGTQRAGTGMTLSANATLAGTPRGATSAAYTVVNAAAATAAFTVQPGNGNATQPLSTMPIVTLSDTYSNIVTAGADANARVILTLTSGTGNLGGVTTKFAGSGVANYTGSNLNVDTVGTGKKLTATAYCSAANITVVSNAFAINANLPTHIAFTTQPGGGVAGAAWSAGNQPVINILDNSNNVVATGADATANVSVAIGQGPGTVSGTTTVAAVAGVATFTNLRIDKVNPNTTLVATKASTTGSGGAPAQSVTSNPFAITVGAGAGLVFKTQPGNANAAALLSPQPVVQITDANGNYITTGGDASAVVRVNLLGGPGPLGGTVTATASSGVATFSGLYSNIANANYTLNANAALTANASANVNSNSFVVRALPPTTLQFVTQPGGGGAGNAWAVQPNVLIVDNYGNVANNSADGNTTVTLTLTTGPGNLGGTTSMAGVAGVANFAGKGLNVDVINTNDVLTASASLHSGNASVTSAYFNITANAALSAGWAFPAGGAANYTFANSVVYGASGGASLLQNPHTDSNSTNWAAGTHNCTTYDATNGYVRLSTSNTTNCSSLDSSWAPQWTNLWGYFSLDGSGSVANNQNIAGVDGYGNPVYLTAKTGSSTMPYVAAQMGQGLTLDGTDDYLALPNYFISGTQMSLSAWFNMTGNSNFQRIFDFGTDTSTWMAAFPSFGTYNFGITYGMYSYSSGTYPSGLNVFGTGVPRNAWSHVAMRYDGLSFTVWINGVTFGSISTNYPVSQTLGTNNNFGKSQYGGDPTLQGTYDEIAIWTTALSPNELLNIYERQRSKYGGTYTSRVMDAYANTQNYNSIAWATTQPFGKPVPSLKQSEATSAYANVVTNLQTSIFGMWRFEDRGPYLAAGGSYCITDDTGSNQGVSCDNHMKYDIPGMFGSTVPWGYECWAVSSSSSANPVSVSAWLKTGSTTGGVLLSFSDAQYYASNTNNMTRGLYMTDAGKIAYPMYTTTKVTATSTNSYNDGQWHHLLGTYNGSSMKLYVDGTNVATTSASGASSYTGYWNYGYDVINGTNWPGAPSSGAIIGLVDEIAVWNRTLTATEANQLWRRGANRLKIQVRSCPDAACATSTWMGPDGTATSYFSEFYNRSGGNILATAPVMTFANFSTMGWSSNRYFQYRAIFESDDAKLSCNYSGSASCSPELVNVVVSPNHYDSTMPWVGNANTTAYHNLTGFASASTCTGGVTFQLSPDNVNWYYWNGSAWAAATSAAQSNTTATINTNIGTFASTVGTGNVYFLAYLGSNGASTCQLTSVTFTGTQ